MRFSLPAAKAAKVTNRPSLRSAAHYAAYAINHTRDCPQQPPLATTPAFTHPAPASDFHGTAQASLEILENPFDDSTCAPSTSTAPRKSFNDRRKEEEKLKHKKDQDPGLSARAYKHALPVVVLSGFDVAVDQSRLRSELSKNCGAVKRFDIDCLSGSAVLGAAALPDEEGGTKTRLYATVHFVSEDAVKTALQLSGRSLAVGTDGREYTIVVKRQLAELPVFTDWRAEYGRREQNNGRLAPANQWPTTRHDTQRFAHAERPVALPVAGDNSRYKGGKPSPQGPDAFSLDEVRRRSKLSRLRGASTLGVERMLENSSCP